MRKGVVGRWVLESTCATTVGSVKCTRRRVLSWLGRGREIERKEISYKRRRKKEKKVFRKKSDRKLEGDEHQLCRAIN